MKRDQAIQSDEQQNAKVSLQEEVHLLSMVDVLEPLSEEELENFARKNPDIRLKSGEIFFSPLEHAEKLFILKEGQVRLYKTNREGEEITTAVIDAGKIFGEMALTGMQLREVYAMTTKPSLIVSLRREDFEDLVRRNPEVGLRMMKRLSERLRQCETRLEDLGLKDMGAARQAAKAALSEKHTDF
jgi:CRP/FNR family transcriptional regulator